MLGDRRSSRQFGGRRMLQSKIIWLADCSSAPEMHLGVSSMPQPYRHVPKRPTPVLSLFSAAHRFRIALSQTGGKWQGWLKTGPVVWRFPMPLSMTPGDSSRSSAAAQHGGERSVVNAGVVCRGAIRYGQGWEGGGKCSAVPGESTWKWSVPYAGGPVECSRVLLVVS